MRIALSGVQGSGKTTLINEMKKLDMFNDYTFYGSISAELSAKHIKMNKDGDDVTQLLVMNGHFGRLFAEDNIIVDRCLLDGLAYTNYNFNVSKTVDKWVFEYAVSLVKNYIELYDVIFYLGDEVPLDDDGTRSMDEKFRKQMVKIFDKWKFGLRKTVNIVGLYGSVEERMEKMEMTINKLNGV